MKIVMKRFFFVFDMDKVIDSITAACCQCSALKKVPHFATEQTTFDPPETNDSPFAADVIKQEKQFIFIMRECFSSYTIALIILDHKAEILRLAIIQSCIELRPLGGPFAVLRTDLSPGFHALLMIPFFSPTRSQLSSDASRMPKKTSRKTCCPRSPGTYTEN